MSAASESPAEYLSTLRRVRADATLRMYEGAFATVTALAAYRRECTEAAGVTEEAYQALAWEGKEAAIRKGRRIIERRGPLEADQPGATS